MAIHTLRKTQLVPATLAECWDFFSDPRNLARITPPGMGFRVTSENLPREIRPGLLIAYRVRPLAGIPVAWLSEITHVRAPHGFVDEQRVGPYRVWHHEHSFVEKGERLVEVRDEVTYALPFGALGDILAGWLVRRQLAAIFRFREKAVAEIFGPAGPACSPAYSLK